LSIVDRFDIFEAISGGVAVSSLEPDVDRVRICGLAMILGASGDLHGSEGTGVVKVVGGTRPGLNTMESKWPSFLLDLNLARLCQSSH